MDSETQDFLNWKAGFSWEDDGLAAFLALRTLDTIRFELMTRSEGYLDRIKIAAGA